MKHTLLLASVLLILGNTISFAQTTASSCQSMQEKIGKDKLLQLYWTEKLGEYLLVHPEKAPSHKDSVLLGRMQIKSTYYTISTSLGDFTFIIYDKEFEISFSDSYDIMMKTRFSSMKNWNIELNDSRLVKQSYFMFSKETEFDPSQQELDALCQKFTQ